MANTKLKVTEVKHLSNLMLFVKFLKQEYCNTGQTYYFPQENQS